MFLEVPLQWRRGEIVHMWQNQKQQSSLEPITTVIESDNEGWNQGCTIRNIEEAARNNVILLGHIDPAT